MRISAAHLRGAGPGWAGQWRAPGVEGGLPERAPWPSRRVAEDWPSPGCRRGGAASPHSSQVRGTRRFGACGHRPPGSEPGRPDPRPSAPQRSRPPLPLAVVTPARPRWWPRPPPSCSGTSSRGDPTRASSFLPGPVTSLSRPLGASLVPLRPQTSSLPVWPVVTLVPPLPRRPPCPPGLLSLVSSAVSDSSCCLCT